MRPVERTPDEIRAIVQQLRDLQEVDREIRDLRKQLALLPSKHKALDVRLAQEHAEIERLKADKMDTSNERRKLEKEIRQLEAEIKDHEDKRMRCKTNPELRAVDLEIAAIRKKIDALETRVLEQIEEEEAHDRKVAEALAKLEQLEREHIEERRRIEEQIRSKSEKLARREQTYKDMRAQIPPDALALYDRLSERLPGSVVCPAVRNHCGGCHLTLVNQKLLEIRQMKTFVRCEGCLRIFCGEEEE
ncbi:MAG: hypothetical protein N3D11_07030 [Candidatus Sumerlaeia bacterium]|nr:hypothetical protein [Candidatus Sumerlaeia bacterium]